MKTIRILLPFAIVLSLLFIGCGKYDEGPAISLKTKKGRLARTWKIEKYIDSDGTTYTPTANDNYTVTFSKDGVFTSTYGIFSIAGTWAFTSDKSGIITTVAGDSDTETILRLTSKEFWSKDSDGDKTYFVAQ